MIDAVMDPLAEQKPVPMATRMAVWLKLERIGVSARSKVWDEVADWYAANGIRGATIDGLALAYVAHLLKGGLEGLHPEDRALLLKIVCPGEASRKVAGEHWKNPESIGA